MYEKRAVLFLIGINFGLALSYYSKSACRPEDGYFRCAKGKCIKRDRVRSLSLDCGTDDDLSDDFGDPLNCTDDEFRCRFTLACIPRHFINTEYSCRYNESLLLPCRPQEFTCAKSKICIPRWMVMNGKRNCDAMSVKDSSDEQTSLPYCYADEFSCGALNQTNNSTQCIPREWVSDGDRDCANGRDEMEKLETCLASEFQCVSDQKCVARFRVLDGYSDCSDRSDEVKSLDCDPKTEFRCQSNGRCIPRSWVGNLLKDCTDGSDLLPMLVNHTCVEGEFRCHSTKRCIPRSFLCDGLDNCGDCSDEIESCPEPRMFRCKTDTRICIFRTYSCDEYLDCPGGADNIKGTHGFKCYKSLAQAPNGNNYCVLPQWSLHDDYAMCDDKSDLCFKNGTFQCHRCLNSDIIIAKRQVCDGVFDCPDLSDECLCADNKLSANRSHSLCNSVCYGDERTTACSHCGRGNISCRADNICISPSMVCDGKEDCPSGFDENYCGVAHSSLSSKAKNTSSFRCTKFFNRQLVYRYVDKNLADALLPLNAVSCDGVIECPLFEDECRANCPEKPKVCDQIKLMPYTIPKQFLGLKKDLKVDLRKCDSSRDIVMGKSVCDGIADCKEGFDEQNCKGLFHCNAGSVASLFLGIKNVIAIPNSKKCNLISNCIDSSDEMNCSSETHFYCTSRKPLFVSRDKVQDGVEDCSDGSDECPLDYFKSDFFASNAKMIKFLSLEVLVWIMAILALGGNITVVAQAIRFLESKAERKHTNLAIINRALILNLALSDLLMGLVLLTIGIKSLQFNGIYCTNDRAWRSSTLCALLGIATVISSETSVLTLVCITFYRILSIFRPVKTRNLKVYSVAICIATIWAISVVEAVLPIIPAMSSYMIAKAQIYPSLYFHGDQLKLNELQQFAGRLASITNATTADNIWKANWYELNSFLRLQNISGPTIASYYGYYSSSSVCMPRLYRTSQDESANILSFVLVTVNFFAIVFITFCYIAVYFRMKSSRDAIQSSVSKNKQSRTVQRRITLLIATDMFCWLPICLMSFISMGGKTLQPVSYVVSAIVLLPINSSLNPLIYSNIPHIIFQKLRAKLQTLHSPFAQGYWAALRSSKAATAADTTTL